MISKSQLFKISNRALVAFVLVLSTAAVLTGQSLDQSKPSPIRTNNLQGHIGARDLGDSRLTDHYYAFTGTPGDLLITIQSRNLNGDLDVFTAGSLRPLLKLTLYAESVAPVTKGIYLRKREDLILRIEARSPNDDEGTYQLFFGGSFEPMVGGSDLAENETATSDASASSGSGKTKRVSSVGARLPEPEPPVTEVAAAPAPTPEATPENKEAAPEVHPEAPTAKAKPTTAATTPRTRRPAGRRTTTTSTVKPKVSETTATEDTVKKEESKTAEETPETAAPSEVPKARPGSRTNPKRTATTSTTTAKTTKPKPEPAAEVAPEPEIGPRLIIETSDGTLINRSMSTVRRVMVENGQVVVTAKDGKIDRIPLANVVRMSIAP
jgi:hypothetical protein